MEIIRRDELQELLDVVRMKPIWQNLDNRCGRKW